MSASRTSARTTVVPESSLHPYPAVATPPGGTRRERRLAQQARNQQAMTAAYQTVPAAYPVDPRRQTPVPAGQALVGGRRMTRERSLAATQVGTAVTPSATPSQGQAPVRVPGRPVKPRSANSAAVVAARRQTPKVPPVPYAPGVAPVRVQANDRRRQMQAASQTMGYAPSAQMSGQPGSLAPAIMRPVATGARRIPAPEARPDKSSVGAIATRVVVVAGLVGTGALHVTNKGQEAAAASLAMAEVKKYSGFDSNPSAAAEMRLIKKGQLKHEAALRQAALKEKEKAEAAARELAEVNRNPKPWAKQYMLDTYGWGDAEFDALEKMWTKESQWKYNAANPTSTAYGIPQMMLSLHKVPKDYKTNAKTQIKVGLSYIKQRYGSPSKAWEFWQKNSHY